MVIANYVALILTLIGAINWGLVGIFNFDLVTFICAGYRAPWAIAIYVVIALSAIWLVISPIISRGIINLGGRHQENKN